MTKIKKWSMFLVLALALSAVSFGSVASASTVIPGGGTGTPPEPVHFKVKASVYDPDHTHTAVAEWIKVNPNSTYPTKKKDCKKDGWMDPSFVPPFTSEKECKAAVKVNKHKEPVLSLQKNAVTSTNSAASASIAIHGDMTLSELGFDYKGYCGAGAPRFNVYTTAGTYYFFGCTYGTHTSVGDGWTQVRFNDADAYPADGTTVFPGFGSTTVTGLEIVQDEEGQVLLDNIDVNGTLVGKK